MKKLIILLMMFLFSCDKSSTEPKAKDCAGISDGTAFENECGYCVGEGTEFHENYCGTVTDTDGKVYPTVKIGEQIWMAKNLRVTHYNDGSEISNATNVSYAAYTNYDYDYFYNYYAVSSWKSICPEGWDTPTDEDWMELEMALGMTSSEANTYSWEWRGQYQGSSLASGNCWALDCNPDWHQAIGNNSHFGSSGFNAQPEGYCIAEGVYAGCEWDGMYARFWSKDAVYGNVNSDELAIYRALSWSKTQVYRNYSSKKDAYSARCVKD